MTRYRIDGMIVDTDRATAHWDEDTRFDGSNYISRATGSQWNHEELYRSRRGRYYVVHWSQWQGSTAHAEWVSLEEAARWLLSQDHDLPDDLADLAEEVME